MAKKVGKCIASRMASPLEIQGRGSQVLRSQCAAMPNAPGWLQKLGRRCGEEEKAPLKTGSSESNWNVTLVKQSESAGAVSLGRATRAID